MLTPKTYFSLDTWKHCLHRRASAKGRPNPTNQRRRHDVWLTGTGAQNYTGAFHMKDSFDVYTQDQLVVY